MNLYRRNSLTLLRATASAGLAATKLLPRYLHWSHRAWFCDLPARATPYGRDEIAAAVDACAAIEVITSRFQDQTARTTLEKLADCVSNGGFVHAEPITDWQQLDLAQIHVSLSVNGEVQLDQRGGHPTGDPIHVDWSSAYPVKVNARLSDYEKASELHAAALAFNQDYFEFLKLLTEAFQKDASLLISRAVPWMFQLRNRANQLIHNQIPGTSFNAAPTFEMANAAIGTPARVTT